MNTLEDTLNTLTPDAQKLTRMVLSASREFMAADGNLEPILFVVNQAGLKDCFPLGNMMDLENKPALWAGVRQLRRACPVVGMVTEVWMAECKGRQWDGVMPRDREDRKEMAMFHLWQGSRSVTFAADIQRTPNSLAPWKIMFDSHFPKTGMSGANRVEGAMMDGEPYAGEGN